MTPAGLGERDRTILMVCGVGAVVYAAALQFFWDDILDAAVRGGATNDVLDWARIILSAVPGCLAVAAVVLTGRAFVAVAIAVAAAIVSAVCLMVQFGGLGWGPTDYAAGLGTAVVAACALLGADLVVWRWGTGTPGIGALAGAAAGVAAVVLAVYQISVFGGHVAFADLGGDYWLQEYGVPGLLMAAVGALSGAAVQRRGVPQVTAGRA